MQTRIMLLLIFLLLVFTSAGIASAEEEFDENFGYVSRGRIHSITKKTLVLKYGTTPEDKIARMIKFKLGPKVHVRKVRSIADLKPGDLVEVDYLIVKKERVVTDIALSDEDPLADDNPDDTGKK